MLLNIDVLPAMFKTVIAMNTISCLIMMNKDKLYHVNKYTCLVSVVSDYNCHDYYVICDNAEQR